MPWLFPFLLSWLLFVVLADRNRLKELIPFGFISMFTELLVDVTAVNLKFYDVNFQVINFFGAPLLFSFGPAFTMGVLYVQSIPKDRFLMILNIFAWTLLFMAEEHLWVADGAIVYINWNYVRSMFVDILAFAMFTILYLKRNIFVRRV